MDTNNHSPDSCIFCAIVAGRAPAEVVYEDEHTLAFLDINPATQVHVLVVSKTHSRDIFDITEEDAGHVMRAAVRLSRAVDDALHPDGVNLIQANRRAAFQSVFHFHVHVIPRWWDDGIAPPWKHEPGEPDVLRETAETIRGAMVRPGGGR